jgi:peptidoglycan/LPS O-acetylase OafA/YrhL
MTQVQKSGSGERFLFADGLRGLAALWVVLFHMEEGKHLPHLLEALPQWLGHALFNSGHLGVPVFLVLSGYVMAWTVRKTVLNPKSGANFLMRRFTRLSPPYYFSILFALLFLVLKAMQIKDWSILPSYWSVAAHLFYVERLFDFKYINTVYWTLWIEIQFYLFFVVVLLTVDRVKGGLINHAARYSVFYILGLVSLIWPLRVVSEIFWPMGFVKFWYCFSAGLMASWVMAVPDKKHERLSVLYFLAIIAIGLYLNDLFITITGSTAMLLFVAGKFNYMGTWLNWKWLQFLGAISYSLYLLHNPLTGAAANIIRRILHPGLLTDCIVLFAVISICIFVAWLAYKIIELPSIRISHRFKS